MNNTPIIKKMQDYLDLEPLSFHTPGHKNGGLIPQEYPFLNLDNFWQLDLTEIEGLDNLHNPTGCILDSERKTAEFFGAKASYYLVNGTSTGIEAALIALANQGQKIFVPRNVHKAVYNGLILANAQPIYLPVTLDKEFNIPLGIEPQTIKKYLEEYPFCKTLILTHPTYQGISYKIEEVMKIATGKGLKVIIDEAHGAHLALLPHLLPTGLEMGAHIVIQSWHKTLPVLGQASVLHLNQNYQGTDFRPYLNLLQTTSPSYLLLASLDACQSFLRQQGREIVQNTIFQINSFKKRMAGLRNLKIITWGESKVDPLKLCITAPGMDGYKLAKFLQEEHHIFSEMAEENYCLLIFPLGAPRKLFLKLEEGLWDLDNRLAVGNIPHKEIAAGCYIPQTRMVLREAFFASKEKIKLRDSLGRICGQFVVKYPPGIPLIVPGEEIDREVSSLLEKDPIGYNVLDGISVVRE